MSKTPLTITETHAVLKEKKFSVLELTDYYLNRINNLDSGLNSFITVCSNQARNRASWADRTIRELGDDAFKKYPLLGCVVAHKDMYLTKGIKTTAGSKVLENYIPAYSATLVDKVERAGAVLIGKTNQDAWAHGSSGENSDFGPAKNPWDPEYVPGGSSSGSAVAVVSDFSLFATGTDTGGSVRTPASFCGVVGFKPTYGAVSRYGVVAMASSLDSMGHITKTVRDARHVFEVTKGKDGKDSTVKDAGFKLKAKGKFTVGVPREFFGKGVDPEVEKNIKQAIDVFTEDGVQFEEVSLPRTKYGISAYYIICPAEVSSNLGRYDGVRYGNPRACFGKEAVRRIMLGTYVLSSGYYEAYYLKAMQVRSKLIDDYRRVFTKVDALIAPVSPTPPFKLGEKVDDPLKMYLADVFTVSANLVGIPSIAIPNGFSKNGLPLGFQLMGPRFSENMLFDIGEKFEKLTGYIPSIPKL